ncbi:MAG: nucleotidyltransferase family protein [Alphaproteobacteria bacterium]|nr:nucleotidyltransferase family protein [Alphaproteobacteria bacterium]
MPLRADQRLEAAIEDTPWLAVALRQLETAALPDAWIVAGAVAQSVWNRAAGRPAGHGIKDLDVVYHDPADLSEAAERGCAEHVASLLGDLPTGLDVKNQARVHLWYERRFGRPCPPYGSSAAAIATYPTTATAIGVRRRAGAFEICAPFGLDDLLDLTVRPNPVLASASVYAAKTARWREQWPALRILPWPQTAQQRNDAR